MAYNVGYRRLYENQNALLLSADGYVSYPTTGWADPSAAWTVEIQFSPSTVGGRQVLWHPRGERDYYLGWTSGQFVLHSYDGTSTSIGLTGVSPEVGKHYTLVATSNGNGYYHLYLIDERGRVTSAADALPDPNVVTDANVLGSMYPNTTGDFSGRLYSFRFWNTERTEAQILATAFERSVSDPDLLLEYVFEEDTGTTTTDTVGSNDGTLVAPYTFVTEDLYGQQFVVTGVLDTQYLLTQLTPGSNYEFRVQEVADGEQSAWSYWEPFSTLSGSETVVEASAALTASGALAADGTKDVVAASSAAFTASGTLTTEAGRAVSTASALTTSTTLSGAVAKAASVSVAAVYASSLAAAPVVTKEVSTNFTAATTLSAQWQASEGAGASLNTQTVMTAAPVVTTSAGASLTAEVTLTGAVSVGKPTSAALVSAAVLGAEASVGTSGVSAALSSTTSLTAAPAMDVAGVAALDTTGTLNGAAAADRVIASALNATGTLSAQSTTASGVSATLSASGTLSATPQVAVFIPASATLTADGTLQATGNVARAGAATLGVSTNFTVEGARDIALSAEFPGWELSLAADTAGGESIFAGFLYAHDVVVRPALEPMRCDLR